MGDRQAALAAPTIRARAAQIIDRQREKMRQNLGAAIDGRDPEGVHDMRVASRRLRAALAMFEPWLERREVANVRRSIRRLTRSLGRVRELDVLRLRLAKIAERATGERKLAIEIVDSRVARARLRARARMMKAFAALDLDALDARLRELAGTPPAWAVEGAEIDAGGSWQSPGAEDHGDEPIATLLEHLGPQVTEEARQIVDTDVPGDIGSRDALTALHAVRIRAKKLRYQLEVLAAHAGPAAETLVETLKGLQDHLGEFHDDVVLDELLTENITRQAARGRPLLVGELRRLRTARRAALRRDERACRAALAGLRAAAFAERAADLFAASSARPVAAPAEPPAQEDQSRRTDASAAQEDQSRRTEASAAPPPASPTGPATPLTSRYAGEPVRKSPPHTANAPHSEPKALAQVATRGRTPAGSPED